MTMNMPKFREVLHGSIKTTTLKSGRVVGCATVPSVDYMGREFARLVGLMDNQGVWVWVHRTFKKN